jgi:hypothetical protein
VAPVRDSEALSPDEACQLTTWPQDKPIAQIVFPHVLKTKREEIATVWVMLHQQEIENLQLGKLYNKLYKNFLCCMSPHPMLLWMTALYNQLHHKATGPRWLRCYLDLKSDQGQQVIRLLVERKQYHVLFFALEDPQHCAYVMPIALNDSQLSQLQTWTVDSQNWKSIGNPTLSKDLLKGEFNKLKPKVTGDLAGR